MPLKKIHWLFAVVAFISVVGLWIGALSLHYYISGRTKHSALASTNREFKTGEYIDVGYMRYVVHGARYTRKLSDNQFITEAPNANFLLVELWVQNLDREERMIPPFKLIDEHGAEYGPSDKSWAIDDGIQLLESLNPSVSKRGFILFDVPADRVYTLKVSGGYWSASEALIKLKIN